MGNTSSRRGSGTRELEKYTKPTGLYPSCPWDLKAARRMIMERKIAPRFPGREAKESCFTQECPICFMYYPGNLNVSTCCKKPICSECFLQMKPPKKMICCPFCNREMFGIKYTAPAVIELSSIYSEHSSAPELARPEPPVHAPVSRDEHPLSQHYASVEDRQKLRDDLRSQLNITVGPITTPPPTSAVVIQDALMYASPADASQLEELMIREAIRRSMYDLTIGKSGADSNDGGHALDNAAELSEDGYCLDGQPVSPSQIEVHDHRFSSSVRRSSNPFDDDFDASSSGESDQLPSPRARRRPADWNPFDHE